jgi:hypothetical protein
VFGTDTEILARVGSLEGVMGFLTSAAPSREYQMYAGAVVPVPAAVMVQGTGEEGTVSFHDPLVYGAGQEMTGAGGAAIAVRKVVQADQVPFQRPRSSLTAVRAWYTVLSANALVDEHEPVAPDAT